jgi:hypothetical protein
MTLPPPIRQRCRSLRGSPLRCGPKRPLVLLRYPASSSRIALGSLLLASPPPRPLLISSSASELPKARIDNHLVTCWPDRRDPTLSGFALRPPATSAVSG